MRHIGKIGLSNQAVSAKVNSPKNAVDRKKSMGQWDTGTAKHKLCKINGLTLSQTVPRVGTVLKINKN